MKSQRPKVSVCVPTYNGSAYLEACLNSIQAQTFKDVEVVIVDDDSADRTCQIAEGYAARDARFRVHKNPSRLGLVGNWNRSLDLSQGEWIKFLFQDDLMESRCLARLVESCEQHQRPFGFCWRHLLFDSEVPHHLVKDFEKHQALLDDFYGSKDGYVSANEFARKALDYLSVNLIGEPTVTIFRRSLVEQFGRFNGAMIQNCDAEYWNRLASNLGVVHVGERLATFRVHAKSTSSLNINKRLYRTTVLDPLVAYYLILHEPHYQNLREAIYHSLGQHLAWRCHAREVYEAWRTARPSFFGASGDEKVLATEWKHVSRVYPKLRRLALAGCFLTHVPAMLRAMGLKRAKKKVLT